MWAEMPRLHLPDVDYPSLNLGLLLNLCGEQQLQWIEVEPLITEAQIQCLLPPSHTKGPSPDPRPLERSSIGWMLP